MPVHAAVPHKLPTRRVGHMEPNIVATYKYGNSTVHIADDCIRTDPVEIERIDSEFHAAGWAIVKECYERGEEI